MSLNILNRKDKEKLLAEFPFPSFVLNRDGEVITWNDLCENHFGYTSSDMCNSSIDIKSTLFSALSPNIWNSILDTQKTIRIENLPLLTKKDSFLSSNIIVLPSTIMGDDSLCIICVLEDFVKYIDHAVQELSDLKNGIEASFMTVTLNQDGLITNCNSLFLKTSHWTPKRVLGKTFWQLFPDNEESKEITQTIWKTLSNGQIWKGDVEKITKDGLHYWVNLTAIPIFSAPDQVVQYILLEQDITREKTLQQQLEKIAFIDTETGLMNIHRLEQVVTDYLEEGNRFYFVYLSIDQFYTVKELHDEKMENNLIVEFTKRLKIYFQDSEIARINENDFVVITPLGEWFIHGIIQYLQQNPIYNGNKVLPITISGGITRAPEDQSNFAQLMKASLATIANVREAGGGDNIVSLSTASHKALHRKSIIEKRLLLALDQKNLKVFYQPQVDLQSGKIIGVEALVRWEDDKVGVVSPDELIPIAEETGLINDIGSFVIEEACKQAVKWKNAGLDLKVSINLSVREFQDKNMARSILDTLAATNCPGNLIQIEITEKFALEAEAETSIIKQMITLENEGIYFVLDDFGTGYASFRYMQLLPIRTVKIDQTFIHSLAQSEKAKKLVNGMVQFGKSINLNVLAEGVETTEQRDMLNSFGCDIIQGFLISKPVTEDGITELLLQ